MNLPLLYQDDFLVAVCKPAGLLVHRSPIDKSETIFALQIVRNQIGQYVFPVHRLDRPTSGVLLFALDGKTAAALGEDFSQQKVKKTYQAVVRGWTAQSGRIDYPLRYQIDKIADRDKDPEQEPQEAITDFVRLSYSECPWQSSTRHLSSRYSLLALKPQHGRKHQIRRHLKYIAHPILGDTTHGDLRQNKALFTHTGENRLMLHAAEMSFSHPKTGRSLTITAPAHWDNILEKLGLSVEKTKFL